MRVLVACEFSGIVRRAFAGRGHDVTSCDLLPADDHSPQHYQGSVFDLLGRRDQFPFDLMIAHPPCTYLSRAGWHWVNKPDSSVLPLKGRPRRAATEMAARFFLDLLHADVPRIAVENPRPIIHAGLPPSTQVIQPWQFGHGEVKETHLWLKGLPALIPTCVVGGRRARVHREPPSPDRWKKRSLTYLGIAEAMAEQWGVDTLKAEVA